MIYLGASDIFIRLSGFTSLGTVAKLNSPINIAKRMYIRCVDDRRREKPFQMEISLLHFHFQDELFIALCYKWHSTWTDTKIECNIKLSANLAKTERKTCAIWIQHKSGFNKMIEFKFLYWVEIEFPSWHDYWSTGMFVVDDSK